MSSFPCLARTVSGSGLVRYSLGHRLVDRYLEFVAGRSPGLGIVHRPGRAAFGSSFGVALEIEIEARRAGPGRALSLVPAGAFLS